jgi:hypothetical protein
MIVRFDAEVERALREAMDNVAHAEADQVVAPLAAIDDVERAEAVALSMLVALYVMIDVCDSTWPNDASVRQIAEDLATTGTTARRLRLDAEEIYTYLAGSVLKGEPSGGVIEGEAEAARLPIIVAQRAIVVYSPKGGSIWEYLDRIESAIEVAMALDATVLPAAVMRAYLPKPKTES